ncbi:MAG: phosphoenolpyruvate carboxykinase (ATP) [Gemmatimonadota bacterium]|nr:phosphoenolpyruvate carboxykinase (ATP) [Gemmatimonadota bacterium]MDE2865479.1 phosphoenolpyruvate carboxykinase (ATP) [Gemmatimonadota bacterium]MYB05274.1 phosphoenolpyruvate carboxykinase (ATP) [Gemmatimonadota bacterium]MYG22087.1 phosphoenolpyruvate carboxykinase (ATP) [Gemmatimonadota bacterium]MYJ38252.1 phosphoenolpyruvate carboxykinase (ATP) [Gemmatimonadota bacterium]
MLVAEAPTTALRGEGMTPRGRIRRNLSPAELYEETLRLGTGRLAHGGGLVTLTAPHTGRSPNDRFVVREADTGGLIDWGDVNVPIAEGHYQLLKAGIIDHLNNRDLYVRDAKAGADPRYGIRVRVISESPWHDLFARNMFLRLDPGEEADFSPDFIVYHAPSLEADPRRHGTNSGAFIIVNFSEKVVLVGGTAYAGEIKKSIFSALNFMLPGRGVLPMHCSANIGAAGDTALFFGLSGTGKTTLSANPDRQLIGDDEHGWSDDGVFNFEGGCYAKTIRLSPEGEPDIYRATRRFGTILENVILDERTREIDYDSAEITENTRASYPIHFIANAVPSGQGGHPSNVVFLTADAFGVLPPIARLDTAQAMYHFLSGYTAKVAGTERGVTEPRAAFSACFGAPFLPRPAGVYADLLGRRTREHAARVWLVNTGWTGGRYGVGTRMKLGYTRAMLAAALHGDLDNVPQTVDPVFGLRLPQHVPGVPDDVLLPRGTWSDGAAYDSAAAELAAMFKRNFVRFAGQVSGAVKAAGPA